MTSDEPPMVDHANGIVLRRVVVGPLHTNCWIVHGVGAQEGARRRPRR